MEFEKHNVFRLPFPRKTSLLQPKFILASALDSGSSFPRNTHPRQRLPDMDFNTAPGMPLLASFLFFREMISTVASQSLGFG